MNKVVYISYPLGDEARFWSKIAVFSYSLLHNNRENCAIIFALLFPDRARSTAYANSPLLIVHMLKVVYTDEQTERQTDIQTEMRSRAERLFMKTGNSRSACIYGMTTVSQRFSEYMGQNFLIVQIR